MEDLLGHSFGVRTVASAQEGRSGTRMRPRRGRFSGAMTVCVAMLAAAVAVVGAPNPAGAAVPPVFDRAWGSPGSGNGQFNEPVGIASAAGSGFVYVADTFNDRVQRFDADGTYLGQFGGTGSGNGQFNRPYGIAVGPDGSVYVADTNNSRIQKFDAGGTFQAKWGTFGSGNGQLSYPWGLAVDALGNVYVADSGNHRVQKFSAAGVYKAKWGSHGNAAGRFDLPNAIAVSADTTKVYVVDLGNSRVQQFAATGVYQRQWGGTGTGDGQFIQPWGITVNTGGDVFVADMQNSRIQQFSTNGAAVTYVTQWGGFGTSNGQFNHPYGIALAPDGNRILVTDTDNQRVQRFRPPADLPGAPPVFVNAWGTSGNGNGQFSAMTDVAVDASGNVYEADRNNHRIQKFTSTGTYLTQWGSEGSGSGQFSYPGAIAVDPSGNVFVGDSGNSRVEKFTSTGSFLTSWGFFGSGDGQFGSILGIAVDSAGNVYVDDSGWNRRIQKFSSTGTYLTQWGSNGTGNGQFAQAEGVAVDASGNVYVADTYNQRIQKFTSTGTYLTQWGSEGSGSGQFSYPNGVAVDSSGYVYVADSFNARIQRFAPGWATTPTFFLLADQTSVSPGDAIDYHATLVNNTADTLTGVTVADPLVPDCEATWGSVAPGAQRSIDCSYITGADDAGPFTNTATMNSDQTGWIPSSVTTQVGPAVTVTMTAPARVTATATIPYVVSITNHTWLTVSGVRVSDTAVPGCAGPVPDIWPMATATVNCTKTTTDADSGSSVFNAAFVDAPGTQGGFATAVTSVRGRITGTITGPNGPVAGAFVLALSRDFLPLQGDTVANGSGVYNLGLDPGRYYVVFLDPSGATQAEYYNNRTSTAQLTPADLLTVNVGSGPATANATLAAGFSPVANPATISGTVTDANGPVAGVWVVAVNAGVRSAVRTNAAGQYTVGNLPAGNAYLEFADPAGTHAFRWYLNNDGTNPTAIPVTAGQHVTGINQVLPPYP